MTARKAFTIDDDLTLAYLAGYHQRDDEVAQLRGDVEQLREDWYAEMDLVKRLRGLLHECLAFAMQAPIGVSSDLWDRVTKELGDE